MGGLLAPGALGGGSRNETVDVLEQGPRPRGSQRVRSAALSTSIRRRLARWGDTQPLLCTRDALGTGPGNGGGMEDTRLWSLRPHVPVKGGKQGDPTRSTRRASVRGAQTAEGGRHRKGPHCLRDTAARKRGQGRRSVSGAIRLWGLGS